MFVTFDTIRRVGLIYGRYVDPEDQNIHFDMSKTSHEAERYVRSEITKFRN